MQCLSAASVVHFWYFISTGNRAKRLLCLLGADYRSRRTKPDNMIPLLCMLVAYNLSMARKAPKKLIPNPCELTVFSYNRGPRWLISHPGTTVQDQLKTKETKDHYFSIATRLVNEAESLDPTNPLVLDAKGGENAPPPFS